jgi:hypothetical protein
VESLYHLKILFYKKFENATELLGVKKIGFECNYTKLGGMIYTHYAFFEDSMQDECDQEGHVASGASTLRMLVLLVLVVCLKS